MQRKIANCCLANVNKNQTAFKVIFISFAAQKSSYMKKRRFLPLLFVAFLLPFVMNAQVTTSSISGFVKSDNGEPLDGATVTAIHVPSGTKYVTLTKKDGSFTLPNTRIGGPFTLTVDYVGFATQTINDINLNLGEPFVADVTLSHQAQTLTEVTITNAGTD